MKQLQKDSFITADTDIEFNQYRILSGLKEYRSEFNKNKIYPSLTELVYLASQLDGILTKRNNPLPKSITGKNINDKNVVVEIISPPVEKADYFYELIEWALPLIRNLIDEAYIIYEFVDDNLTIEQVGYSTSSNDTGYLIIKDNAVDLLNVYRYNCINYPNNRYTYNSLIANFLMSIKEPLYSRNMQYIKMKIVDKYNETPDIPTFFCSTELNFPFSETIFPIAKRKLLSYLFE